MLRYYERAIRDSDEQIRFTVERDGTYYVVVRGIAMLKTITPSDSK